MIMFQLKCIQIINIFCFYIFKLPVYSESLRRIKILILSVFVIQNPIDKSIYFPWVGSKYLFASPMKNSAV